jgi:hypothetical protein
MTKLRLNITMSLHGYVAGPNQSVGIRRRVQLHEWATPRSTRTTGHD